MKLNVDIVTPKRLVLSSPCDEVTLPGAEGEMGVLPEHAALVSKLSTGVVSLKSGGAITKLAVRGGFLQVLANQVTLLTDEAQKKEEVDATKLQREKTELEAKLLDVNVEDRRELFHERDWIEGRQALLND